MYAVFFMSQSLKLQGVEDQSIHVFETEQEADDFIFEKLVEAGQITTALSGTDVVFDVGDETYPTSYDAVDAVQAGFEGLEFFHSYPAAMHVAPAA